MSQRFRYVCNRCNSENILMDVRASWNFKMQEWEVAGDVFDDGAVCVDCFENDDIETAKIKELIIEDTCDVTEVT